MKSFERAPIRSLFGLVVALAAIAGAVERADCSDNPPGSQAKIVKEVFPIIVNNPRHPAAANGSEGKFALSEDLTIGVKEGDENYMFGDRLQFSVDDRGNIYAVDWDRKRIQKYGPDGRYLLTIGHKGQGPGEFQNIWTPFFDAQGDLYVRDAVNNKIAFFGRDGKMVRELRVPDKVGEVQINSRGEYAGYCHEMRSEGDSQDAETVTYGLFGKDFSPLTVFRRSIRTFPTLKGADEGSTVAYLGELMSQGAFVPQTTLLLGPDDRIYVGCPESYEIRVYSSDGRPERLIRKDQPVSPVTESHKKDYAAYQEREFLFGITDRVPESVKKKALSLIRYPKSLPAYQRFTLLDNGWLAVVVDAVRGGMAKIDFFNEKGAYVAEVSAPLPTEGLVFKKDKAYAIVETDDGFRFIKRFTWTTGKPRSIRRP